MGLHGELRGIQYGGWRLIVVSSLVLKRCQEERSDAEMEGTVEQYVFVRLHALEGYQSDVEEALREVTGPSREEGGCLSFHTFRSMRDRRFFFIHSQWMDEAAFQKHAELPHTVRFLERVESLLDQPRDVTRTEMIG